MRYLVTGGSGFIGSNTVDELVRRGHDVTVLDDLSNGKEKNLEVVRGRIEIVKGTITDPSTLKRACAGADYVLHMAARTSVPRSVQDPAETNNVNVDGTLNVLLAARDTSVRRVIFSGSSSVYGETPTLPKREDMPPAPISPYGVSKLVGELYGIVFHRVFGLEFVSLRYFNVFGPRQDRGSPYSGVLSLFITAMLENRKPTVFGDGEQSRDFTFVSNVVAANLLACEAPGAAGKVLNIGTGVRCTLNQTLRLLEKFAGHPAEANYAAPRSGDIRDSQADITLAQEMLGYRPKIGFEEGLRLTWDWYKAAQRMPSQT
ncbi:MAG TPA: SDR family oxidoreductase [Candidatus Acidoferrales bacterium]|nr:SDR family oxidoreductase [Candidatus Acidoferrales bacterium]